MQKRLVFVTSHAPTPEQVGEAEAQGLELVELEDKGLLLVPDDPGLGKEWFEAAAAAVEVAVGGFGPADCVVAMGQQQLASAIAARARRAGSRLLEAVSRRESVEEAQADGSVRKTSVFRHLGFREVHSYE